VKNLALVLLVGLAVVVVVPARTAAWGRIGHQAIADVAQQRLSPAAKKGVYELLHGATLASVATEADNWVHSHPETERWHWVDIPITAAHYDAARDCKTEEGRGDCVIAEIDRLVATLRDRERPEDERAQALKFLVHFVGDLHCPVHSGDNADRGGNDTPVVFFDRLTQVHSVWDSGAINRIAPTVTEWDELLEKSTLTVSAEGTPIQWAEEAHDLARDVAYRLPADKVLGQDYVDLARPVVELQLLRAGVRLAKMLNDIFGE
jgi:hypothetical protein